METRIAIASVLSVAILQLRFASGVPTGRPSRAASDGMGYNELVASLSAGSAAVLYLMVRTSIIIYSRKINAFDEIHLKAQQSLSILPSPSDTTQQDTFWKSLQALTHLSGEFAQLEDLVANGNDVNDSDIMVTYELMKPLKRNLCSYVREKGLINVQTSIDKLMIDLYRQQLYWVLHLTVPERSCKTSNLNWICTMLSQQYP